MKILYRIAQALVLLAVASSFAHANDFMYFKKKAAAGVSCPNCPAGYLLAQGFEGTGYDCGETWTTAGDTASIDIDNTTTPGECTQSARVVNTSQDTYIAHAFTAASEQWAYFRVRFETIPGGSRLFFVLSDATTARMYLTIGATGAVTCTQGTVASTATVSVMAANTWYDVWTRYKASTATNGICEVGFSTDGTEPTSGNNYSSTAVGNATQNIQNILLFCDWTSTAGPATRYDKVRLDDADIGSNPN